MKKYSVFPLFCMVVLLAACGSYPGGPGAGATPPPPTVNGFGTEQNHVHSLVVLPDATHTLVLATHAGIFRSQDHGASWQQTAGGPHQLMQGLMTYWLSSNPLDPQRLYVLTLPAVTPHKGTLGLYTSGNGGKTWQLATPDASTSITFAQAGNDSPSEVYIDEHELGVQGLRVSTDQGHHFTQAGGPLPFGDLTQLLAAPGEPGHLFVYGADGIASTTDGGKQWHIVPHIQGGIFEMTTPGAHAPLYASGDAGVYVSRDGGQSFTLVETPLSYSSLQAAPQQPNVVYGKLGLGVYRSTDGGKSWSAMPALKGNLTVLAADPTSADQVYLALSYPTQVYHFQSASHAWKSITPPAAEHG